MGKHFWKHHNLNRFDIIRHFNQRYEIENGLIEG